MKFIDLAENGNNSPLTYVSGILLIFILYFLDDLPNISDFCLSDNNNSSHFNNLSLNS